MKKLHSLGITCCNMISALGNLPQVHLSWQPSGQCQRGIITCVCIFQMPRRWGNAEWTKPCCTLKALCKLDKKSWAQATYSNCFLYFQVQMRVSDSIPGVIQIGTHLFVVRWVLLQLMSPVDLPAGCSLDITKMVRFLSRAIAISDCLSIITAWKTLKAESQ